MILPTENGRYRAQPNTWGVKESGDNRLPTFVCLFDINEVWNGEQWVDVSNEQMQITGYFYLLKKDGQINKATVDSLKKALDWQGANISSLQDEDWSFTVVQLVCENETYNNRTTMKVKFINHRDYEGGGVERADDQTIQSLDAKYGPLLRAVTGAKATTAPKSAPPAANPPQRSPADQAKVDAWEKFKKLNPGSKEQQTEWFKAKAMEYFPGKQLNELGAVQWRSFADSDFVRHDVSEAFSEPAFANDDIPF